MSKLLHTFYDRSKQTNTCPGFKKAKKANEAKSARKAYLTESFWGQYHFPWFTADRAGEGGEEYNYNTHTVIPWVYAMSNPMLSKPEHSSCWRYTNDGNAIYLLKNLVESLVEIWKVRNIFRKLTKYPHTYTYYGMRKQHRWTSLTKPSD